jgi:hypothetical protein
MEQLRSVQIRPGGFSFLTHVLISIPIRDPALQSSTQQARKPPLVALEYSVLEPCFIGLLY